MKKEKTGKEEIKEEEIKEMMNDIKVLREMLTSSKQYARPLLLMFAWIGFAVSVSYIIFQIIVLRNSSLIDLWSLVVWVGLAVAILAIFTYFSRKAKSDYKVRAGFSSIVAKTWFFAIFVAVFIQILPSKISPFYFMYHSYFIWFIAYAFALFVTGIVYSLNFFTVSAFVLLAAIPVTRLFPCCEFAVAGIFLGGSIMIPSLIGYRVLKNDK